MKYYGAVGEYNLPVKTSRTIARYCGYGFTVTAPEDQFGEFMERKLESLRVPDWAWFTKIGFNGASEPPEEM